MHARLLVVSAFAVSIVGTVCEPQPSPVKVTREQFRQLEWIAGTWRGSGGAYPAFFEEYRILNDTTIKMRSFSDSTLRVATDSSTIEWRNGSVQSRSARLQHGGIQSIQCAVRSSRRSDGRTHICSCVCRRVESHSASIFCERSGDDLHDATAETVVRRVGPRLT